MSTDRDARDQDERDLAAELASPAAGQVGIPVDAICVGCRKTQVKRASAPADTDPDALEASDLSSFKHVCHTCQTATWWNPIAVLSGLMDSECDSE